LYGALVIGSSQLQGIGAWFDMESWFAFPVDTMDEEFF
jgi:hypothetical protein